MLIAILMSFASTTMLTSCGSDDESGKDDNTSYQDNHDETFFIGYWLCAHDEVFDFQASGRLVRYKLERKNDISVYREKEIGCWEYDEAASMLSYSISNGPTTNLKVNFIANADDWFTTNRNGKDTQTWNRIYSLPEEPESQKPQFSESDFIGLWQFGSYVFWLRNFNELEVYHISDMENNLYDEELNGSWSYDSSNNKLEVSYTENEYGTTINDSWSVVSVTHDYIEFDGGNKWLRVSVPNIDVKQELIGTWTGKYDNDEVSIEITFQSNGNFTIKEVVDGERFNSKGTWSYSDSKIRFTYKGDESILANTCGDVLSIYDINDTILIIYGGGETVRLSKR